MASDAEERISRIAQALFRANPLLLVGSGFSCGYGLPGMGALGDHLASTIDPVLSTTVAKDLWASVLPAVRVDLEAGLNTIASGTDGRDELVAALRSETAAYITQHTRAAERRILLGDTASEPPVRLLRRLFRGVPQNAEHISVITTNYDTLIELFCDLAELPVDTGFTGFSRRRFRTAPIFPVQYRRSLASDRRKASFEHNPCLSVRLMKPHGSITWQMTPTGPVEVFHDLSGLARAVVVPGPTKYEDALISALFDSLRAEMNAAVVKATTMLCIGFGFNDRHLQTTIGQRLEAGMPAVILARDFTPSIRAIVARHSQVLAIQRDGTGAVASHNGDVVQFSDPVWELDVFLKRFLE